MKSAVVFLCVVVAVCSATIAPNWGLRQGRTRIARELRRELEKMGLPEQMSRSAPRPTKEALELMIGQSVGKTEPKADTIHNPKSIILPAGGSSNCKRRNNDSTCTRFEYNVSTNVIPSTAKLMVHKSGLASPENLTIWAFCLNSNGDGISAQEVLERTNQVENGWLLYSFPVLQQNFWKDSTKCGIEISGSFSGESNPPVLLVQEEEQQQSRRRLHKRQAEQESSPNQCRAIPVSISFEELGMSHLIVHPVVFETRVCCGTCELGESTSIIKFFTEAAFRNNRKLEDSQGHCGPTCCRPREYQDLHITVGPDGDHKYSHKTLANVIVKSCSCS